MSLELVVSKVQEKMPSSPDLAWFAAGAALQVLMASGLLDAEAAFDAASLAEGAIRARIGRLGPWPAPDSNFERLLQKIENERNDTRQRVIEGLRERIPGLDEEQLLSQPLPRYGTIPYAGPLVSPDILKGFDEDSGFEPQLPIDDDMAELSAGWTETIQDDLED